MLAPNRLHLAIFPCDENGESRFWDEAPRSEPDALGMIRPLYDAWPMMAAILEDAEGRPIDGFLLSRN